MNPLILRIIEKGQTEKRAELNERILHISYILLFVKFCNKMEIIETCFIKR
jgi:hypothetical protein